IAYIGRTVWPVDLSPVRPYPPPPADWQWLAALIVLTIVSAIAIRERHRRPYLPIGWFWYIGTLVPVIGLVQVGTQPTADRYMYLPSIGLFLAAVWTADDLLAHRPSRRAIGAVVAVLVIAAFAIIAREQVHHWQNSIVLWQHAIEA